METSGSRIVKKLTSIKDNLIYFIKEYSSIKRTIFPEDGIITVGGDYSFNAIPENAIPKQDKLYKEFNVLMDLIEVLFLDSMKDHLSTIQEERSRLLEYIEQNTLTWKKNKNEVIIDIETRIEKLNNIIKSIFTIEQTDPILVPDTNALYFNTNIESWTFNSIDSFSIALTPSVLKDLDRHKIEHRNQEIRDKAKILINKIKEYRRRGKLTEGVTIKKNRIDLFSVAIEPDFSKTLKWLDSHNEDDRLIAEYLELMRKYSNRSVILSTGDINLQNKCEVADIIYYDPTI